MTSKGTAASDSNFIALVLLVCTFLYTIADHCTPNPCKHGKCDIVGLGTGYNWNYTCTCDDGFTGAQCQWDSPKCHDSTRTPCQNDGVCAEKQDGRFCNCPGITNNLTKYGGHYCEIVNPCNSCPSHTMICQYAATRILGRVCLDDNSTIIEEEFTF